MHVSRTLGWLIEYSWVHVLKTAKKWMTMKELNEYHKQQLARKQIFLTFMRQHPLSQEECLNQVRRLREQRIARESKLQS